MEDGERRDDRQQNQMALKRLTADGSDYRSQGGQVSLVGRAFPSLAFYSVLAPIVWMSSSKAKQGRYGGAEWSRAAMRCSGRWSV